MIDLVVENIQNKKVDAHVYAMTGLGILNEKQKTNHQLSQRNSYSRLFYE